jgi:hypothetical protein
MSLDQWELIGPDVPDELRALERALDDQDADDAEWFAARDAAVVELTAHNDEWQAFLDRLAAI